MGCENSNEIKDSNKTAPITPNNILFSPSSSTNKENIINKNRRSSQVKINNLRRSIFDKNNNIPNELSHLNNKKKSFSQSPIKNISMSDFSVHSGVIAEPKTRIVSI